ncbi:hypothetical protein A4X13_0g9084 [Tilletia indica]|uniref:Uncharacterized protein n=1 Tax=Tilletia indica TaxID=43049 RepID=A0A177T5J5_9BASI|nr:hypothetical protein A4X13_0g9084 [Tilletia indica]
MLTNVIRLLVAIKTKKAARGIEARPTLVALPLSPNHEVFGSDGFYSESTSFRSRSLLSAGLPREWSNYLSITGAVVGWVRGTGLMEQINTVAKSFEKLGLTFSLVEMASNTPCRRPDSAGDLLPLTAPPGISHMPDWKPALSRDGQSLESIRDLKALCKDQSLAAHNHSAL